jgi:ribosomal protein S20
MQAVLYKDLGDTEFRTGNIDQAIRFYSQALKRNQEIGAQLSEVSTLIQLVENYCTLGDFNQAKIYYKQAEKNIKDIDVKWAEAWILIAFSWLMHYTMDNETAKEQSQQALHILGETGSNDVRWNGLIILGHALTQLGELKQAEAIYNQAVTLGFETQLPRTTLDALAGLARIFMARSAMQNALIKVEEILIYLETEAPKVGHPLDGTKEPFNIYLTCYQVLNAIQDPRAPKILSEAYTLLKTRADKISDEQLRHSFLNNVAANRDIVREYQSKNKVVK